MIEKHRTPAADFSLSLFGATSETDPLAVGPDAGSLSAGRRDWLDSPADYTPAVELLHCHSACMRAL